MTSTSGIEQVARAVLYEGFLLYPYRLSSVKNRHRWNFGVLYPEPFCAGHGERSFAQTECLIEAGAAASVDVKIRFLQLVEGVPVEREVLIANLELAKLTLEPSISNFMQAGVDGLVTASAANVGEQLVKLTVRIANLTAFEGVDRDEALALSLISVHAILTARAGRFVSLIDPPECFQSAAAQCSNIGLWPVLAGQDHTQMLSAPIILYDQPQIAPQSPGDLFDGTEIDEILTLRIQTLTEAEKLEMSAADPRARIMLERSEALSREELLNLHASMRGNAPHLFKQGDRVRMRPRRRSDIFDLVLAGKLATVTSVEQDFEDGLHICVVVDDDPGKDLGLEGKPGHRFFFGAEELEPV